MLFFSREAGLFRVAWGFKPQEGPETTVDYENYDNDTNEDDDDYFDFIEWLSDLTAAELRAVKSDPAQQRLALCRYYKRGERANIDPGPLIDYLGVSSPSIFDMAGYSDEEGDAAMQISDGPSQEEIQRTILPPV